MGMFLNRGITEYESAVNSDIYIDKTDMIQIFSKAVNTEQRYICVSRPRRFGKTMTANMLAAYFEKGSDSRFLFEGRKLGKLPDWDKNLNRFDVIRIDLADLCSSNGSPEAALDFLEKSLKEEVDAAYPGIIRMETDTVTDALARVNDQTEAQFIIIIDEWDALFRDEKNNEFVQTRYINLLRALFKGNRSKKFTALAYITGILPIKKYNSESALNNFIEYTMLQPFELAEYTGFTTEEVRELCDKYKMNFDEVLDWYDGYSFGGSSHIFGPNSVVRAMLHHRCDNYWSRTAAYSSLTSYILMNFDGLKAAIVALIGGARIRVNVLSYKNDMTSFARKDDVLTVLIHLGYLAFDSETKEAWIPNKEVREIFENTLADTGWDEVIRAVEASERLLKLTLAGEEEAVAESLDRCHRENTSILNYNDENALSVCISLAYYSARQEYTLYRELAGGYGFADIVFVPKKRSDKPAMIVELKWKQDAKSALKQIEDKKYPEALKDYHGEVVLVGINYDKEGPDAKHHSCSIRSISL